MYLPTQARSVNRDNRFGAAVAAGVNPAIFGLNRDDIVSGAKKGLGMLNCVVNG